MTKTLNDIDENIFKNDKYNYSYLIDTYKVNINIFHFYSEYSNHMVTILSCKVKIKNTQYEMTSKFPHTMSITDFNIEFEKENRKYKKIITDIVKNIEIDLEDVSYGN